MTTMLRSSNLPLQASIGSRGRCGSSRVNCRDPSGMQPLQPMIGSFLGTKRPGCRRRFSVSMPITAFEFPRLPESGASTSQQPRELPCTKRCGKLHRLRFRPFDVINGTAIPSNGHWPLVESLAIGIRFSTVVSAIRFVLVSGRCWPRAVDEVVKYLCPPAFVRARSIGSLYEQACKVGYESS
jgi:hypothetical protein